MFNGKRHQLKLKLFSVFIVITLSLSLSLPLYLIPFRVTGAAACIEWTNRNKTHPKVGHISIWAVWCGRLSNFATRIKSQFRNIVCFNSAICSSYTSASLFLADFVFFSILFLPFKTLSILFSVKWPIFMYIVPEMPMQVIRIVMNEWQRFQ